MYGGIIIDLPMSDFTQSCDHVFIRPGGAGPSRPEWTSGEERLQRWNGTTGDPGKARAARTTCE